jgi:hypothetical protein
LSGVTRRPFSKSVGTQYAAVSLFRPHVVSAAPRSATVAWAPIARLPKNGWSWDVPGRPGYTIGSSGAMRLTPQWARKVTTCDRFSGERPALAGSAGPGSRRTHRRATSRARTKI